jgi:hypothetical protein
VLHNAPNNTSDNSFADNRVFIVVSSLMVDFISLIKVKKAPVAYAFIDVISNQVDRFLQ